MHTHKPKTSLYILLTYIMIAFFYQLDAQIIYFNTFIIHLYMFEHYYVHLQEDNCIITASGTVTLCR